MISNCKLRDAVAEIRERQILEYDIGEPAIGRRVARALDLFDQGIGALRLVAHIEPRRILREVDQIAVGPDAADLGDRAFAQPDRERDRIAVVGLGDAGPAEALAAAGGGGRHGLLEARRPQELARRARPAVSPRDRRALGRGLDVDVGEARPLARDVAAGRERRIDLAAEEGADGAADLRARDRGAENRKARAEQRRAQRGAHRAEDERCHGDSDLFSPLSPCGREIQIRNANASLRRHSGAKTSSLTRCSGGCGSG